MALWQVAAVFDQLAPSTRPPRTPYPLQSVDYLVLPADISRGVFSTAVLRGLAHPYLLLTGENLDSVGSGKSHSRRIRQ